MKGFEKFQVEKNKQTNQQTNKPQNKIVFLNEVWLLYSTYNT